MRPPPRLRLDRGCCGAQESLGTPGKCMSSQGRLEGTGWNRPAPPLRSAAANTTRKTVGQRSLRSRIRNHNCAQSPLPMRNTTLHHVQSEPCAARLRSVVYSKRGNTTPQPPHLAQRTDKQYGQHRQGLLIQARMELIADIQTKAASSAQQCPPTSTHPKAARSPRRKRVRYLRLGLIFVFTPRDVAGWSLRR